MPTPDPLATGEGRASTVTSDTLLERVAEARSRDRTRALLMRSSLPFRAWATASRRSRRFQTHPTGSGLNAKSCTSGFACTRMSAGASTPTKLAANGPCRFDCSDRDYKAAFAALDPKPETPTDERNSE